MTARDHAPLLERYPPWLLAALLLICSSAFAQDKPCDITLGSCHRAPLSAEGNGIIDKVIHEAFRRVGKQSCVLALPCERSLLNASTGDIDGDIMRIPAVIDQRYPHLRTVSEPLYTLAMSAFALRKDLRAERLEDLAPLRVGYIIGWKILEEKVQAASILRVRSAQELFMLLAEDRADIVIYERLTGMLTAEETGLKNIRVLDPPLIMTPQHLVLHERHANLLEPLAKALHAMKADGSYDRIFRMAGTTAPAGK